MKDKASKMLTVAEVAGRLSAGESSVRLWARSGRLKGARMVETPFGSYWEIPESSLTGFEKEKPGPKPRSNQKKSAKK